MKKWSEGQRAYYVINGRVCNTFVSRIRDDNVVVLKDGKCRYIDEVFKTKEEAMGWLHDEDYFEGEKHEEH